MKIVPEFSTASLQNHRVSSNDGTSLTPLPASHGMCTHVCVHVWKRSKESDRGRKREKAPAQWWTRFPYCDQKQPGHQVVKQNLVRVRHHIVLGSCFRHSQARPSERHQEIPAKWPTPAPFPLLKFMILHDHPTRLSLKLWPLSAHKCWFYTFSVTQ